MKYCSPNVALIVKGDRFKTNARKMILKGKNKEHLIFF
jgi:hypothetical protein